MATITYEHATLQYPGTDRPAVNALDLEIADGEFLVLVGPSGCGKSTSLRMLAGLEEVTGGSIRIGERDVTHLPPKARDIAMVFQNYALYPHMTVADNMGFALKIAGMRKDQIRTRVEEAARILDLTQYLERKPKALSGGQRQRVAMGRAIVRQPQAFLMDEPLSNLDAKLRVQMRAEIGRLQRDLGVTTIYVTHDQTEAMTLGHRVAVMKKGVLQQIAPPQELYDRPTNLFVAGFIGSPAMNFLTGQLSRADDGSYAVALGTEVLQVPEAIVSGRPALAGFVGRPVIVGIRPEELEDAALVGGAPGRTVDGIAELVEPLGSDLVVHLSVRVPPATEHGDLAELAKDAGDLPPESSDSSTVVARFSPRSAVRVGDKVAVAVATEQMHFFDPASGAAIWSE